MTQEKCVKVVFKAKVKLKIPDELQVRLRQAASDHAGFLGMKSQVEDEVETTYSYWRSMDAVKLWSKDPLHALVKKEQELFYDWVKLEILKNEPLPNLNEQREA